jgi:hypothetical protein
MKKIATKSSLRTLDNNQLSRATGGSGGFELVSFSRYGIISPDQLVSPDSFVKSGGFELTY